MCSSILPRAIVGWALLQKAKGLVKGRFCVANVEM